MVQLVSATMPSKKTQKIIVEMARAIGSMEKETIALENMILRTRLELVQCDMDDVLKSVRYWHLHL